MNDFPLFNDKQLMIKQHLIYAVVGGIMFKINTFAPVGSEWFKHADLIVGENGRILIDTGVVDKAVVTLAIRTHLTEGAPNPIQLIELDDFGAAEYDEELLNSLVKVSTSVRALYK